jgi:hypothetical protein
MNIFSHGKAINSRLSNREYIVEHPILLKIQRKYIKWKTKCLNIKVTGIDEIKKLIIFTNNYFNEWERDEFAIIRRNGQCKVYPSIMEEFFMYLFKDIVKPPFVSGTFEILAGIIPNPRFLFDPKEPEFIPQKLSSDYTIGRLSKTYKDLIIPTVVLEQKKYADKAMRDRHESECKKIQRFNKNVFYALVVMQLDNSYSKSIINEKWSYDTYLINEKANEINLNENSLFKLFYAVNKALQRSQKSAVITKQKIYYDGKFN